MAEELYKLEKERENVMVKVIIIDAVNVRVSIGRLVSETISLAFLILGRCTRLYFSQIWSVLFPSMVRTRWRVRASVGPEVGGRGGGAYGFFYLLSDTNVLASTRSHITIQLSDFVPKGDRGGGGVGGAQVGLEVILDLPAKKS